MSAYPEHPSQPDGTGTQPHPGPVTAPTAPSPSPAGRTELVLAGRLVLGAEQFLDLPVRFSYTTGDPLAITLGFPGPAENDDSWQFARDLLWEGLQSPAGAGDVRIWPPCLCHGRKLLRIMLRGREGTALVDVPVRHLRRWLRRECFALVPPGTEGRLIDWDAELAGLARDR